MQGLEGCPELPPAAAAAALCAPCRLVKALSKPVILVKANAKNAAIDWSKDRLKCMVQVRRLGG